MFNKCIICNEDSAEIILNELEMRQCKKCQLIWLKKIEMPKEYYTDLSPEKTKPRINNSIDRINTFKTKADLNNLCDIGCGDGTFSQALKQKGYKNVIGIEPNADYIDFAKRNNLEIFQGRLEDFPAIIKNKNIHTITIFHLLEHLKNPLESLRFIYDNLQSQDALIIETPDINSYSFKKAKYKHRLIYSEHIFYFSEKSLKKLLEKIGFKIVASGRRDFNQNYLGIKDLLFRLGLSKKIEDHNIGQCSDNKMAAAKPGFYNKFNNSFFKRIKSIIRFILSKIVIFLGRLDFIWIIAKKQ